MYSGTTFRIKSGRIIGVHQRIDRVARRALAKQLPRSVYFPLITSILHFEGYNGPDAIKRKSPARDEPWHYIDPNDSNDRTLVTMINDHIHNLTEALVVDNHERAAFEAAWLSHAITDGLTPAHHYPLEAKLEEWRGEGLETRISAKDKLILPGRTRRLMLKNNWEFWGAKGVMTTHVAFELGVAMSLTGWRMSQDLPHESDFKRMETDNYENIFLESVQHIASLGLYEEFSRVGWSRRLAHDSREILIPIIVENVCLAWYSALYAAQKQKGRV